MISAIELIKTLTCLLRKNFPDINIEDNDIEEGFDRPSFFIDVLDMKSGKIGEMYSDGQDIKIYFFAENRKKGYLDLFKVKNVLRYLLSDNISLADNEEFIFSFEDIEFHIDKKDKTLQVEGTILLVQDDDHPDDTPNIEELEVNLSNTAIKRNQVNNDSDDEEEEQDFVCEIAEIKEGD